MTYSSPAVRGPGPTRRGPARPATGAVITTRLAVLYHQAMELELAVLRRCHPIASDRDCRCVDEPPHRRLAGGHCSPVPRGRCGTDRCPSTHSTGGWPRTTSSRQALVRAQSRIRGHGPPGRRRPPRGRRDRHRRGARLVRGNGGAARHVPRRPQASDDSAYCDFLLAVTYLRLPGPDHRTSGRSNAAIWKAGTEPAPVLTPTGSS